MTTYASPWVRRRADYWATHPRRCRRCGSADRLTVHHRTYVYPIGEEPDHAVVGLCARCHRRLHDFHRRHRWLGLRLATVLYVAV